MPAQLALAPWAALGCSSSSDSGSAAPLQAAPLQTANKAVSIGSSMMGRRYNHMADFVDLAKAPPPVPFRCYFDASSGIIAPSQNGVTATRYFKLPLFMPGGGLYAKIPVPMPDGTIQSWTPHGGDAAFADDAIFAPGKIVSTEGLRGATLVNPYTTWKGHPTLLPDGTPIPLAPLYLGIRLDGAVSAIFHWPVASRILGWVTGVTGALDMALYPPNRKIFYVADQAHDGTGRIIRVDRTAAIAARSSGRLEDGALWQQSDLVTGVGRITGLACMDDGTLYAADRTNRRVLKIATNPVDGTVSSVSVFLGLPVGPFALEYTSSQNLVILDEQSGVYVFDRTANSALVNLTPPDKRGDVIFGTLSVDRNGTFGERDQIAFSRSHSTGNNECYFLAGPNWSDFSTNGHNIQGGNSTRSCGDTAFCGEVFGHYPWAAQFHPDQGLLLVQGFAQNVPSLIRPANEKDPPRENWAHDLWNRGLAVVRAGTVSGKEGTKPSWTCQMDVTGGSLLGVAVDYIADMSKPDGSPDFAAMAAFIHAGGIGSYPRPEIVGSDLLGILYFVLGQSQRLIQEGQPLLDKLVAAFPGAWPLTGSTPQVPAGQSNDIYIRARVGMTAAMVPDSAGKSIRVLQSDSNSFALDFLNIYEAPIAYDPAVTVDIMLDDRMIGTANAANNWALPLPSAASGQHALTCRVTSASSVHYGEASAWIKA